MELKHYLSTLWKWSWLIFLATLVAAVSGYWGSSQMPRTYRTSTTLMVGRLMQSPEPNSQDLWTGQQLANTYVQLVNRQPILRSTIEALDLGIDWQVLAGRVSAQVVGGTQLFQISVVDTDPRRAKILTDEIAYQLILQSPTTPEKEEEQHRQFVSRQLTDLQANIDTAQQQVAELENRLALETSARAIHDIETRIAAINQKVSSWQANYAELLSFYSGGRINYLSVVEPAVVPMKPISPRTKSNVLLAASIGFLLAAGAAFLLEYLDDTIKTSEDVDRVLELPALGAIARIRDYKEPGDAVVTVHHPRWPVSEAYRVLRTNVQFSSLSNPSQTLLVTSAKLAEGKTTTAANLAVSFARADRRVILVDADLRRPSLHRLFGVPNNLGLTSLLLDRDLPLEEVLFDTGVEGLQILPSGPLPPNPAELLESRLMKERLDQMKEWADIVIFDSPPVLYVADAAIVGAACTGTLLVVGAGRTRSDMARRAKETLAQVEVRILGVVLNQISVRAAGGYYYYGYYSHLNGSNGRREPGHAEASDGRFDFFSQLSDRLRRRSVDRSTKAQRSRQ